MPRAAVENNRYAMRLSSDEKARLMRAASIARRDLKEFILDSALQAAEKVIDEAESLKLSERDTLLWLDLLDNPPKPTAKLVATAVALSNNK